MIKCEGAGTLQATPWPTPPGGRSGWLRAPADSDSGSSNCPARILVVEDDYFVGLQLEHRLIDAGFQVIGVAGTAEEALEMAISAKPELAIMDIRLGGQRDGVDVAIDLFANLGIPSIFATAHNDETTRRRGERASPLGWLQKPHSSETLITLVNDALAKRS